MVELKRVALFFSVDSDFGRKLCEGIHTYCAVGANWTFNLSSHRSKAAIARIPRGPDGIITDAVEESFTDKLAACGLPCVNVSFSPTPLPMVRSDERLVGRVGAEHFLRRGFRRFAFCGSRVGTGSQWQEEGFREATSQAGFQCVSYYPMRTTDWRAKRASTAAWIERLPRPIAVMASNDSLGHQVLDACLSIGITVPQEVAVLGTGNNHALCLFTRPPLSSIAIGGARIGHNAAALLDRLMRGERPPAQPILIPPVGVIGRQSTDALAVEDPHLAKALRFIQEHACDPIGVEDILAELPISRRSLERRFHRILKRSLHEEIRAVQLERARRLLTETRLPIIEVARSAGLGGYKHISTIFRRRLDTSPSAYRRQFPQIG